MLATPRTAREIFMRKIFGRAFVFVPSEIAGNAWFRGRSGGRLCVFICSRVGDPHACAGGGGRWVRPYPRLALVGRYLHTHYM